MMEVIQCLGGRTESRLERVECACLALGKLKKEHVSHSVIDRKEDILRLLQEAKNEHRKQEREELLDQTVKGLSGLTFSHAWDEVD